MAPSVKLSVYFTLKEVVFLYEIAVAISEELSDFMLASANPRADLDEILNPLRERLMDAATVMLNPLSEQVQITNSTQFAEKRQQNTGF